MPNTLIESPFPRSALVFRLNTGVGRNQIQKVTGNFSATYMTDDQLTDTFFALDAAQVYESASNQSVEVLALFVKDPVTVAITMPDDTVVEMPVKQMLVIDYPIKGFKITAGVATRVYINSITKLA